MLRRKPAPLTPAQVRKRIVFNDLTQKQIASELKISEAHLSKVLNNLDSNKRVWNYILALPDFKAA